ncbi:MAG: hypothetical protein IJS15_14575 [Victivallales bacterium]|nr:hypothetical protein [Victivallales bacterium]
MANDEWEQRVEERVMELDRAVCNRDWAAASAVCSALRYTLASLAKGLKVRPSMKKTVEAIRERQGKVAGICDKCGAKVLDGQYMMVRRNSATGETTFLCGHCAYALKRREREQQLQQQETPQ